MFLPINQFLIYDGDKLLRNVNWWTQPSFSILSEGQILWIVTLRTWLTNSVNTPLWCVINYGNPQMRPMRLTHRKTRESWHKRESIVAVLDGLQCNFVRGSTLRSFSLDTQLRKHDKGIASLSLWSSILFIPLSLTLSVPASRCQNLLQKT